MRCRPLACAHSFQNVCKHFPEKYPPASGRKRAFWGFWGFLEITYPADLLASRAKLGTSLRSGYFGVFGFLAKNGGFWRRKIFAWCSKGFFSGGFWRKRAQGSGVIQEIQTLRTFYIAKRSSIKVRRVWISRQFLGVFGAKNKNRPDSSLTRDFGVFGQLTRGFWQIFLVKKRENSQLC